MRVKTVKTEAAPGGVTLGRQASTQTVSALLLAAAALLAACSRESSDTLGSADSTGCAIANENRTADIPEDFDTSGFLSGAGKASGELAEYLKGGSVSPGEGSCPSGEWGFNSAARKTCCSQSENPSAASTPQENAAPEGTVTALALFGIGSGGGCLSRSQVSSILQDAQQRGYTMDRQLSNFMSAVRQRPASRSATPCGGTSQTSQAAATASAANEAAIRESQQRAGRMLEGVRKVTPPTVATPPTTVPNEPTNKDFWTPRIPGQTALPTASGQTNCSGLPSATIKGSSSCPVSPPSTSLTAPQPE